MGLKDKFKRKYAEMKESTLQKRAALKIIEKRAKAQYYRELEKAEMVAATRKAKAKANRPTFSQRMAKGAAKAVNARERRPKGRAAPRRKATRKRSSVRNGSVLDGLSEGKGPSMRMPGSYYQNGGRQIRPPSSYHDRVPSYFPKKKRR